MNNYGKEFYEFISENSNKDPHSLRLSIKKESHPFDTGLAITQIECRKRNAMKLKDYISHPLFLFPDSISGEQASHQGVGYYHASLSKGCKTVLDMTAGLGIDSFSFAKEGINVTSVELDPQKAEILKINASSLRLSSLKGINENSIEFLKNNKFHYDLIFIDPSRRDAVSKRVYNLRDCSPDVIANQDLLENHATRILIKASPLLDISQTARDFKNIFSIKAVGVKGECKEILIELRKKKEEEENHPIILEAVNLDNEGNILNHFSDEINIGMENEKRKPIPYASIEDIQPGSFLLEPSPMIMKIAPWNGISELYNAKKMGKSSHLFLASSLPQDFPGRVSIIEKTLKKQDRKSLMGFPASVISKNYPSTTEEIRRSYNLKEGDDNFIYATRLGEKPLLLLTRRI